MLWSVWVTPATAQQIDLNGSFGVEFGSPLRVLLLSNDGSAGQSLR